MTQTNSAAHLKAVMKAWRTGSVCYRGNRVPLTPRWWLSVSGRLLSWGNTRCGTCLRWSHKQGWTSYYTETQKKKASVPANKPKMFDSGTGTGTSNNSSTECGARQTGDTVGPDLGICRQSDAWRQNQSWKQRSFIQLGFIYNLVGCNDLCCLQAALQVCSYLRWTDRSTWCRRRSHGTFLRSDTSQRHTHEGHSSSPTDLKWQKIKTSITQFKL